MEHLEIAIRELHARTGHYVRKAAAQGRIIVTHRGEPMAELRSLSGKASRAKAQVWGQRELLPAFKDVADQPVQGTESGLAVSEDRERG